MLSFSGWFAPSMGQKVKRGAILKVYVHPSALHLRRKRNNECGPAWKTLRTLTSIKARPEAHICCALPPGKGTTLTVETRHNSCTLQDTLSMQGVIQRFPKLQQATSFRPQENSTLTSLSLPGYTRQCLQAHAPHQFPWSCRSGAPSDNGSPHRSYWPLPPRTIH